MDLDDDELRATRKLLGVDKQDGSDKNVGSIEEDIKVLEIFLKEMNNVFQQTKINNTKERNALKNLLQDYARQKQINEEHQKINGELREKVKELEKESKENKKKYLALLLGQFPDTTETYKKYKKELDKLLEETNG